MIFRYDMAEVPLDVKVLKTAGNRALIEVLTQPVKGERFTVYCDHLSPILTLYPTARKDHYFCQEYDNAIIKHENKKWYCIPTNKPGNFEPIFARAVYQIVRTLDNSRITK